MWLYVVRLTAMYLDNAELVDLWIFVQSLWAFSATLQRSQTLQLEFANTPIWICLWCRNTLRGAGSPEGQLRCIPYLYGHCTSTTGIIVHFCLFFSCFSCFEVHSIKIWMWVVRKSWGHIYSRSGILSTKYGITSNSQCNFCHCPKNFAPLSLYGTSNLSI